MTHFLPHHLLPHRSPFLFIDKIESIKENHHIITQKYVSFNDAALQGLSEDIRYLPTSVQIEMIEQSITALYYVEPSNRMVHAQLQDIHRFVRHRDIELPSLCRIESEVTYSDENKWRVQVNIFVDSVLSLEMDVSMQFSERPTKAKIHGSAYVHPTAILGNDVEIGPNSVIGEYVSIGNRTKVEANVIVEKWTKIGEDNHIFSGAVIGSQGQDLKYDGEESWVYIGDRNEIREYVTINRATGDGAVTRIGNDCIFMINVHIAHNCDIHDNVIMANGVTMGGHAVIEKNVVIGGMSGLHQFLRVGQGAMLGGYSRFSQDIPPFMLCSGNPAYVRGLNSIGLRRQKFSRDDIKVVKEAYRLLYRSQLNLKQALEEVGRLDQLPALKAVITFLNAEKSRGYSKKQPESEDSDFS